MSAQRHNVHRCVCMCPGDPCVWSAVVHTQENIFISTCTRGVQAWVDHSDRIIQVSAGQCIQHRSAICVFTALTCTDLQISSKRLLFLNFGLEQIQNSKKSGRKKKTGFSLQQESLWYLDVAMSSLMSPIHIPLGSPNHKLTTTTTATAITRSWMRPKCRTREIWKDPTEKNNKNGTQRAHLLKKLGWNPCHKALDFIVGLLLDGFDDESWRLPFFKIHQLSNTLGGDWVRYGEILRSKKSFFGPSVCIPVPNQDSTQTHLRSEHFDSSQVLQLNSSYTHLTHETREFYQAFEVHIEPQNAGKISEKQKVLYHRVLAEVWINLVGLWVWLEMISQFLQDIFSPNSTSMNSWFEVEAKTKTLNFPWVKRWHAMPGTSETKICIVEARAFCLPKVCEVAITCDVGTQGPLGI